MSKSQDLEFYGVTTKDGKKLVGQEAKDYMRQEKMDAAKKELEETDTLTNKAKARLQDVGSGLSTMLGFGSKSIKPSDHEEKVERLKKEVKGMKSGGKVSSASKRADGCAIRGKTKGKMV
jgi:hypothetical protein